MEFRLIVRSQLGPSISWGSSPSAELQLATQFTPLLKDCYPNWYRTNTVPIFGLQKVARLQVHATTPIKHQLKSSSPTGVKYHWAPNDSYRLEKILEMIQNWPNRSNMHSHANLRFRWLRCTSKACSESDSLEKRLYCILVNISGGITGFVQVNDTHLHHVLKSQYRKKESQLMLPKLLDHPQKVPAPDRNDIKLLTKSMETE